MICPEQEKTLRQTILNSGIKYLEVYHELCDHYMIAIEEQMKEGNSFDQALEHIHTEFGRAAGLIKLQQSFADSAIKHYRQLQWQEFKRLFTWPSIINMAVVGLLSYVLTAWLQPEMMAAGFLIITILGLVVVSIPDRTIRNFFWGERLAAAKTLRFMALRKQAMIMIGFIHLVFLGSDVALKVMATAFHQLHHVMVTGLLVLAYCWCLSYYRTVRNSKPKLA